MNSLQKYLTYIFCIIGCMTLPCPLYSAPKAPPHITTEEYAQNINDQLNKKISELEAEMNKETAAIEKKLSAADQKLDKYRKEKEKIESSFLKCWKNCPNSICNDAGSCRCYYNNSCNACGKTCNNRFSKAFSDIDNKILKQAGEAEEISESLEHTNQHYDYLIESAKEEAADTLLQMKNDMAKASKEFQTCLYGIKDGKKIFADGTYSNLDECLKDAGWIRTQEGE